jgi:hypothetical protein
VAGAGGSWRLSLSIKACGACVSPARQRTSRCYLSPGRWAPRTHKGIRCHRWACALWVHDAVAHVRGHVVGMAGSASWTWTRRACSRQRPVGQWRWPCHLARFAFAGSRFIRAGWVLASAAARTGPTPAPQLRLHMAGTGPTVVVFFLSEDKTGVRNS